MSASGAPVRIRGADNLQARIDALRAGREHRKMMGLLALAATDEAKALVPKKTGNLYRTIRTGNITDKSAQIKAGGDGTVGYAAHVEFGTKPHTILPVRAKALAWGGARRLSGNLKSGARPEFFAARVEHPGTSPQPYLVPGAKRALERGGLRDAVIKTWNEAA